MTNEINPYQADSADLLRSQIILAGYNPRKLPEKAKKLLKANIKARGLMGGLIVNKTTGNLVQGHQRIAILDEFMGYPAKDYYLRVEIVELSEQEEKEQNIFLNNRNAQGEYDELALKNILGDIDYKMAGLDDTDMRMLGIELNPATASAIGQVTDDMKQVTDPLKRGKEAVKDMKQQITDKANANAANHDAYVMISFTTFEAKAMFLQRFGFDPDEKYIPGEAFNDMIERVEDGEG